MKFSTNMHDPTRAISDLKIAAYSYWQMLLYVKARKPTHRYDKKRKNEFIVKYIFLISVMHTIYQTSLYL